MFDWQFLGLLVVTLGAVGSTASAQADASSSAADDDRPDARGSDEAIIPRSPRISTPASLRAHAVPAT